MDFVPKKKCLFWFYMHQQFITPFDSEIKMSVSSQENFIQIYFKMLAVKMIVLKMVLYICLLILIPDTFSLGLTEIINSHVFNSNF